MCNSKKFLTAPKSTVKDCNCSTQTVIVGFVLGLIIIILSLYAGYVTILIRRYRARKGLYVFVWNKTAFKIKTQTIYICVQVGDGPGLNCICIQF